MQVYFISARVENYLQWWQPEKSLINRLEKLFFEAGFDKILKGKVGIKLHFGEYGNVHYLRPVFVHKIVEILKGLNLEVELIETCGLGAISSRTTAKKHLEVAKKHGFCEHCLGVRIRIIDGEHGLNFIKHNNTYIAEGLREYDSLLILSHVKGHIQAGFGGAIKNVGVGLVAKPSKYYIHFEGYPKINLSKCIKCDLCMKNCPVNAIKDYRILEDRCLRCNVCVDICKERAIEVKPVDNVTLNKRIVKNARDVLEFFGKERIAYINFLLDIIPHCDCHPFSDIPIVPDIGIMASRDIVSIDKASIDLINSSFGILGSSLSLIRVKKGEKKFTNPDTNYEIQIEYASKLNLGTKNYEIIELD